MARTDTDEAAFMSQLMQGLDDDFWNAAPTPDPSPVKKPPLKHVPPPSILQTPTKQSKQQTSQSSAGHSANVFSANEHDIASFLAGSENWDLDADPFTPIKPSAPKKSGAVKKPIPPPSSAYVPDPCTRCVVESVTDEYLDNRWRKTLIAKVEPGEERVEVYLCDDWYQTDIRLDDIFNIIGTFSPSSLPCASNQTPKRSITLTSQSNLLILHPDLLLTATALSNAPQCRRKPLLSSLVRATSDITPSLVWGNMLHEVMQKCLIEQKWGETFIEKCIDEAVRAGLGDLVKLGLSEEIAKREVGDRAKGLRVFAERYLTDEPKPNAALTNTRSGAYDAPSLLAITKLLDIEEDIWSPTYGIKGKLDATVQGIISDPVLTNSGSAYSKPTPTTERSLTHTPLPLELKTGRALAGMEHRAQTMLYTLLLSERYGADVRDGLLFYTQSEGGEVVRVPRGRNEVRGLVGVRNDLVGFMWRRIRKSKGKKERREAMEEGMDVDVDADVDMEDGSVGAGPLIKHASKKEKEDKAADEAEEEHFLPPPIDDERACKRCYALDTCLLFRKTHPNHSVPLNPKSHKAKNQAKKYDPPIPDFLADVFESKTAHLTPARTQFFRDWERLLALEERDLVRFKRELWTLGARERERRGRCFGGMVLVPNLDLEPSPNTKNDVDMDVDVDEPKEEPIGGGGSRIHKFTYTFVRSRKWSKAFAHTTTPSPSSSQGFSSGETQSLLNGHLSIGDAITVSVEPRLLALARGFIVDLTPEKVVLGVDHDLDVGSILERLRRERGSTPVSTKISSQSLSVSNSREDLDDDVDDELLFRIDKDELFGGMARVRNNLAQLFYAGGDRKRLELVVDLRKPVFSPPTPPFLGASSSSSTHLARLNASQLAAMDKVLSAEDYALILGMPGTGKTTVIAEVIRELVRRGKTVLLSSYTHSAVDTILMKLDQGGGGAVNGGRGKGGKDGEGGAFGILRLGNVDKVHPEVRKYTLNARRTPTTAEQLEKQLMDAPVVATTCLSIDHALFSCRKFDYCIVDEASQITLPTCLGPLRFADTFVLVGDHFQLPPLVKNPEARKGGLDVSLFRRLSEAHPEAVVDLRFQYRMNEDIMLLSNRLIYDDRLKCGDEEVKKRALGLRDRRFLDRLHRHGGQCQKNDKGCWLTQLADENCKAVFVDTDALPAPDSRVGDLVQNTTEAELIRQFIETLLQCGVQESQIGIISLYRQQVKLLGHLLLERKGVEILTADKSQGRDKDCVIVSLVRSNNGGHIGDLMKDWRRMNVSFTRARSKLVIFGSRKTLQREPLLAQFFELMEGQGWIVQLPPGAHTAHARVFDVCATPSKRGVGACDRDHDQEEDEDEVEFVEVKKEGDGEQEVGFAPAPAPSSTPASTPSAVAPAVDVGVPLPRKVGKENTLLGWLKPKDEQKEKYGSGLKDKARVKEKEKEKEKEVRPKKKMRLDGGKGAGAGAGVLKGRPILQDLAGNET